MTRLTYEQYDAIPAVRWSSLKELAPPNGSPLRYQYRLKHPRPDTASLTLGSAAHVAVFEPDEFPRRYLVYTKSKTKGEGARKDWDAAKEAAAKEGKTILGSDEYDTALAIRDAVRSHPVARKYLERGQAEHTIEWTDRDTNLNCKARLDWLADEYLIDLKTARAIDAHSFASATARLLYHGQLAFYLQGLDAIRRQPRLPVLIAVENAPPYDVAVYRPDAEMMEAGHELVRELLAKCRAAELISERTGMAPTERMLSLPRWAVEDDDYEWEVKESNDGPR